ncbi:uncharacterized protein LOC130507780 [Raphanus sativus]|uniref:Uncharacterized protein LOC130499608 n=1 Tax=Raphanus sativus TaxID=3726 RepID=A0A9W3CRL9_RAPSA|nr:uncharacterized protein LOC130499608 [Raphanus sativus]XP_056854221.1 uncharacterized protein LOC130503609 [Raphanus sativus]XP_056858411.1 uncharacterized protein LOC130507780 [Raphanus sativus]
MIVTMFENRYPFRGSSSAGKYSSPPPPQTVNESDLITKSITLFSLSESQIATATQVHLNRHARERLAFYLMRRTLLLNTRIMQRRKEQKNWRNRKAKHLIV